MNPKLLVVVLFLITFAVSFLIYLFVVNIITPHIDLSSTTKGSIEVAPEFNESNFHKNKMDDRITALQEKAMQDSGTYESDISGLLQDSNQEYQPLDEVNNSDEENLPGLLDKDDVGSVRVPGDDISVNTGAVTPSNDATTTNNTTLPSLDDSTNTSASATTSTDTSFAPDKDIKKDDKLKDAEKKHINRVVVGSYNSIDDAKKAYDDMVSSDLDVAPIIKEIDGNYTLQVGAFSDKNKAQTMVKTLNNKDYSATIVDE